MRTSERGMSRAVFFSPRGENYTANGTLHTCGVVLFDRSAAMQHSVMVHLFAANTNVQTQKGNQINAETAYQSNHRCAYPSGCVFEPNLPKGGNRMPYAILRFQKAQAGGVAGRDRHNERKKEEYKSNPNIDKARSERNYHLVEPNGMYARCCKDRINAVGARTRSNSVIMVEALITTSPEVMEKLNSEQQRQFFERAAAFLY